MQPEKLGHVLVVDDEAVLAGVVASYLDRAGFSTTVVEDGREAVALARELNPTVIILDLNLPGLDGIEVCRQVRTFSDCYLVMLTARTDEVDVLIGLSVGADDYITKPFSARELVARVQAMLRRPRNAPGVEVEAPVRCFGELEVDPSTREVRLGGDPIELTPTEFDLLSTLSARPRLVHSRGQLIEAIWGGAGDEHSVDVHVANLRRKLGDDPARHRYIITVRGVGYRMGER